MRNMHFQEFFQKLDIALEKQSEELLQEIHCKFSNGVFFYADAGILLKFAKEKGLESTVELNEYGFYEIFVWYNDVRVYGNIFTEEKIQRLQKEGLLPMISVEMFTQQLDEMITAREELAKAQEEIECEIVDAEQSVLCFRFDTLKEFAKLNNLELKDGEQEERPLRASIYCYVEYKGIRIITYLDRKEYERWKKAS